jgi:uncharacterized membrane protein YeaQ/YmgE (transglycosylase-associated protein family)
MKRLDLVQLTIIIVGIISAFSLIGVIPAFFIYLFRWFSDGLSGGYLMEAFIGNIILVSCYSIAAIYAIKNSKQLARWVCDKANLHADINFSLDKTAVLFVLFTGLGVYGLIKTLPQFLTDTYQYIKNHNRFGGNLELTYDPKSSDIAMQAISILLFFTLVYYANVFSDFLSAKIKNTEPADEINNKTAE